MYISFDFTQKFSCDTDSKNVLLPSMALWIITRNSLTVRNNTINCCSLPMFSWSRNFKKKCFRLIVWAVRPFYHWDIYVVTNWSQSLLPLVSFVLLKLLFLEILQHFFPNKNYNDLNINFILTIFYLKICIYSFWLRWKFYIKTGIYLNR